MIQIFDAGTTAKIDRDLCQRFIHGHHAVAIAHQTFGDAHRFEKDFAKADADIFDRVVRVDVEIALGLHFQVAEAVLGQLRQHVVQKAHACVNVIRASPVQIQGAGDLRF